MNGDAMFFDSMKGDRIYNAADFREWLHNMFSEGVSVNDFFVSPAGGMSLIVPDGYVHIRGASKHSQQTQLLRLQRQIKASTE